MRAAAGAGYACFHACVHRTNTMSLTRKARAKALQGGATYEEIGLSIDSCLLCGACEAACPENIGLADLNIYQRQELNRSRTSYPDWYPDEQVVTNIHGRGVNAATLFLAGASIADNQEVCSAILKQIKGNGRTALAPDDGQDIARFMEAGLPLKTERVDRFLSSLRQAAHS